MRICAFVFLFLLLIAMGVSKARTPPVVKPWELRAFFQPLRERLFLFNCLGSFFFFWGLFVPFNFLILAAGYYGMSEDMANYQISILNGTRSVVLLSLRTADSCAFSPLPRAYR